MYTLLTVLVFVSVVFLSATTAQYNQCFYTTQYGYCLFLDIGAVKCYACTQTTADLLNQIPSSVLVEEYHGPCGCILLIHQGCLDAQNNVADVYLNGLFTQFCPRDNQLIAKNIYNNETCLGCSSNDTSNYSPPPLPITTSSPPPLPITTSLPPPPLPITTSPPPPLPITTSLPPPPLPITTSLTPPQPITTSPTQPSAPSLNSSVGITLNRFVTIATIVTMIIFIFT